MNKLFASSAAVMLAFALTVQAASSQTATATTTFEVQAVDVIGVSGNPPKLTIVAPAPGAAPAPATDNTTTWSVTTNGSARKVTGVIDQAMPSGVTLEVALAAPTGATSAGNVTLTNLAADLVTGITQLDENLLGVTYTLSATLAAGAVAESTRTVTYTILAGV